MRKFVSSIRTDVGEFSRASHESTTAPAPSPLSVISLLSPASSSSPIPALDGNSYLFRPSISIRENAFELVTLSLIGCIIFFCFFSLIAIFYLGLKSRRWRHLRHFNSTWITRIFLVTFASLWALAEALRLNVFRGRYLFPFLPSMSLDQQMNICKIYQVFSLGFLEPGFLVTLLLLVNFSTRTQVPHPIWNLVIVCAAASPIFALQTLSLFFWPSNTSLPNIMHESSLHYTDHYGNAVVLCKYPVLSILIFSCFAGGYILAFLVCSWKVVSLVINKNLAVRVNALASTIMVSLPLQILFLAISTLCTPVDITHRCTMLAMFLSVAWLVVTGEFMLVITPITEALLAGRHFCPWRPRMGSLRPGS